MNKTESQAEYAKSLRANSTTVFPQTVVYFDSKDASLPGRGGAPTRNTALPKDDAARKAHPVASGFLDYFPDAVPLVSHLSYMANEKHNPGEPMHWARGKSSDEPDTMMRHFMARGTFDDDGFLHDVKIAWRALANLQKEIERRRAAGLPICLTKYYQTVEPPVNLDDYYSPKARGVLCQLHDKV